MSQLVVTLPGQTFNNTSAKATSGNSGTVTAQTAGTAFNLTALSATDQFFNTSTEYTGAHTISFSGPGGSGTWAPTYTTAVSFTSGLATTVLATRLYKAATTTITASDGTITGPASSSLTVNPSAINKLQLLVPGETADPASTTGKTGTPSTRTAGSPFNVTVNAVDSYWNVVSSTDTVRITSSDANAVLPANAALVAGTKTFSVTLQTAGNWTITATDQTNGGITANTSPSIPVTAGPFAKLQLLLPGETAAPGTVSGKTGTPTAQTVGTPLSVTVNAVDAYWNLVSSATDMVAITSTDGNAVLPANVALVGGTQTVSMRFKTAGSWTVTATDVSNGGMTANTSPSVTVNPGPLAKLQVLAPGETAAPGSLTGKTGTPTAQTAGTAFNVTVTAVDAYWNFIALVTDTVGITSSDANAILPANAALVAGTKNFSVTLQTAGSRTVTASDITDVGTAPGTSSPILVNPAAFTKLQLLVPGESATPGTPNGKSGTPTVICTETAFQVTVNGVDAYWNLVSGATDTVRITSSDGAAVLPANAALVAGTQTFSVTLNTGGTPTLTASDIPTPSITANTSPSITVNQRVAIQVQPVGSPVCAGTAANFSVTATGTGLSYQWRKNGTPIGGATSSTYSIASAVAGDAGDYSVVVSGTCAPSATSQTATLTVNAVPAVSVPPASQIACTGSTATLSVTATGGALTYQWRKGGVNVTDGGNVAGATTANLILSNVSINETGIYRVEVGGSCGLSVTSDPATLTVLAGVGAGGIAGPTTVCAGQSGVVYSTTPIPGAIFNWTMPPDAIITSGQGTTAVTVTFGVTSGGVSIGVDLGSGSCSSSFNVTVLSVASIVGQPIGQTICAGLPATFSVVTAGAGASSYQWRRNGVNLSNGGTISGVTSNVLSISSTVLNDRC